MTLMLARPDSNLTRTVLALAALCALASALGACATTHEREAYFDSRTILVTPKPGSGTARVAMWPAGAWGRSTIAVADRRTASDARPQFPDASSDSSR